MGKGWGYGIDYVAALASDDAAIALYADGGLAQRVARAWSAVAGRWGAEWTRPYDAVSVLRGAGLIGVAAVGDVALVLGVEPADLYAVLVTNEWDVEAGVEAAAAAEVGGYAAARRHDATSGLGALLADVLLHDEADRLRLLKAARARRSAHLRNQAKHGGARA